MVELLAWDHAPDTQYEAAWVLTNVSSGEPHQVWFTLFFFFSFILFFLFFSVGGGTLGGGGVHGFVLLASSLFQL